MCNIVIVLMNILRSLTPGWSTFGVHCWWRQGCTVPSLFCIYDKLRVLCTPNKHLWSLIWMVFSVSLSPTLSLSLSLSVSRSLSLSRSHTHRHVRTHTHACMHTHTHTHTHKQARKIKSVLTAISVANMVQRTTGEEPWTSEAATCELQIHVTFSTDLFWPHVHVCTHKSCLHIHCLWCGRPLLYITDASEFVVFFVFLEQIFIFCLHTHTYSMGGRGGSIGRESASRSNGLHDQRFKSRPGHKTNL